MPEPGVAKPPGVVDLLVEPDYTGNTVQPEIREIGFRGV